MATPAEMRHSLAHIFAGVVMEMYPNTKLAIGPSVDDGFYYDIESDHTFTPEDFKKIEKEMRKVVSANHSFEGREVSKEEAIKYFDERNQPYKVELLQDLEDGKITFYSHGDFTDLCKGGHTDTTGNVGAFKLDRVAGAYWRGDERNQMLQRIYGLAFPTQEELDKYLEMREEAKKRDHRKLGQALDLFVVSDLVGPGLPLFTPRGTIMREEVVNFVWDLMKPYGYQKVNIPHIAKSDLYKTSGHYEKFVDDIFYVSSKKTESEFIIKPMNCPHHTQIYASRPRSYRDLPFRFSEVTTVYRDENTGQLQGLSRVRNITQDDAHVFCRMSQVKQEAINIYEIVTKFYKAFNMELKVRLSAHDPEKPDEYLGGAEVWQKAEGQLKELLDEMGKEYFVAPGEAAFYGPKIDFIALDAIGREWQLATIQLDFNLPERFNLTCIDEEGNEERIVMIHRAISGSIERFLGVIIEHYAGAFPTWLAPEQVRFIAVSDKHNESVQKLQNEFVAVGIRAEADTSSNTVGKKIREAETMKVPYSIVVGDKEEAGGDFQVRRHGKEEQKQMSKEDFISHLQKEITERA